VDSADETKPLTSDVFPTQLAALEWVRRHDADLVLAMKAGTIGGFRYVEMRYPARFLLSARAGLPYLACGSRVIKEAIGVQAQWYLIGIPEEHVPDVCARLASGLVPRRGPFADQETAYEEAWRVKDDWRVMAWGR
jgi:hypothetical protein